MTCIWNKFISCVWMGNSFFFWGNFKCVVVKFVDGMENLKRNWNLVIYESIGYFKIVLFLKSIKK